MKFNNENIKRRKIIEMKKEDGETRTKKMQKIKAGKIQSLLNL